MASSPMANSSAHNPLLADPALGEVAMIAEARRRGLTWNQVALAIGCPDGKTAKAKAKRLARAAQKAAVSAMREEAAGE